MTLDETTRLVLAADKNTGVGTIERYTASSTVESTRNTSIVFIDKSTEGNNPTGGGVDRKFSLSDKFGGYPQVDSAGIAYNEIDDGFTYTMPYATTLDEEDGDRITEADIAMIRSEDGTNKNFRYVRLQRLANPLINWDAVINPYLTIDSMEVDLVTINGADPVNTAPTLASGAAQTTPESADNAVSLEKGEATRILWGFQRPNLVRSASSADSTSHYYENKFDESLGRTNDLFSPTTATGLPFPWLTWNNRPFVSHTEIMNVPYLAPDRLTYAPEVAADDLAPRQTQPFTIGDAALTVGGATKIDDPYTVGNADPTPATRSGGLAGRYGHLLNFFAADDETGTTPANRASDVYKLLDYIEVPSRFVNNESYYLAAGRTDVFTHPFNTISRYRAPGKININTIPSSDVWDALASGQVAWSDVQDTLHQDASGNAMDFGNPFRPAAALNLVPGATNTSTVGSACMLTRPADTSTTPLVPLFDYAATTNAENTNRNAAFRNSIRNRLGKHGPRPSPACFACWITVGLL